MKNLNNVSLRDQLIQMPTQQLDVLLEEELAKDPADDVMVRLILSILKEREGCQNESLSEEVSAAWEKYLSSTDRLRDENDHIRKTPWTSALKAASLVLVSLLLLTLVSQEVQADTFLQRLFRWTDSIFEVFTPGYENTNRVEYVFETDHPGLQQVYDAVCELGVSDPIVPTWLPEGYELVEIKEISESRKVIIGSIFSNGDTYLVFTINIWDKCIPSEYHKDAREVKIFEKAGIMHSIMNNNGAWTVVWNNQNAECVLTSSCHDNEILKILESIYTWEDF